MCKFDFEKAHDNLSWKFVRLVMEKRIPLQWIEWIKTLLTTNRAAVVIGWSSREREGSGKAIPCLSQ